jgi:hypothetical protein
MVDDVGDVADDVRAERLLAEANLHRLRQEWPEAEEKCREAVGLTPHDAAAHALLGDVCVGGQRAAEAERAYRAALELHEDEGVQRKLDEILAAQAKAATDALRERGKKREGLLATQQARTTAAIVFAGVAVLAAAIIIGVQLSGRRRARPLTTQTRAPAAAPSSELFGGGGDAAMAAPAEAPAGGSVLPQTGRTSPIASSRPLVQPTRALGRSADRKRNVISIARIPAPLTDREKRLVHALSQIRLSDDNPIGTPFVSASIDPDREHLVISFEVPVEVSRKPSRSFMRMRAQELLIKAAHVDDMFRTASVRIIVGWTDPKSGTRRKDVAFRGDAKRASILTRGSIGPGQARESILDDEWWNPTWGGARSPRFVRR